MKRKLKFNRMELAGSLGDIGTLLPIAMGMILVNQLSPVGVFFSIGLYYVVSGIYFGVPVPVQPMKVIGAYAIAMGLTAQQILASELVIGAILLVIGVTNMITWIGRVIPKAVIRGVQLSTGTVLMVQGVKLIVGTNKFQQLRGAAEPYLQVESIGSIPIGIVIGIIGAIITLLLIDSRRFPAGLVIVSLGGLIGLLFGTYTGLDDFNIGIHIPEILTFEFPVRVDFVFAFFVLVLPQLPMTVGNAILAYVDLSKQYFGEQSKRVTCRSAAISMAFANILSFGLGGMPLCHGSGGLAAHYRFGARTIGSNIIIGVVFMVLALFFKSHLLGIVHLIPMAILGVLLLFAGTQLALTIQDLSKRNDLFIAIVMLGVTLASTLAYAFGIGMLLAVVLKWRPIKI